MSSEVSTLAAVGQMAPRINRKPPADSAQAMQGKEPPVRGQTLPPEKPAAAPEPAPARSAEAAEEELLQAVERLREQAASVGRDLNFEVDRESGYTVIKVIDRATEEVVRQIPSEEVVERARHQDGDIALIQELA